MSRLSEGGLIDRSRKISFRFNGREYLAHPGDTLASALLANDVRLVGRSFKYHRPRGTFTAGSEEPNALLEVGSGSRMTPNTRATMQEVYEGLEARSQNAWPSLTIDLLAVNDLLAPFLAAGFYYKTFMWPQAFWEKIYEPAIRRAAGLGRLPGTADSDASDKAFAHCDLLVIGSGPSGLMAALTAGMAGARVILADEDFRFGGRLLDEAEEIDGLPAIGWVGRTIDRLNALPNVRLMRRTTVTGAYDGGTFGALERISDHVASPAAGCPRHVFWRIAARRAILAGGAQERGIAFPGNDRPGVMLAGAVRTYLQRYGVAAASRFAVFTNNDDGWRTAHMLADAGLEVAALIDTRPGIELPDGPWKGIAGGQVISTRGRKRLTSVTVATGGGEERFEVDGLAVSGGWNPGVHLTCHMNGRPVWNTEIAAFVPAENAVPGLLPVGAANGTFGTRAALESGRAGGIDALGSLGLSGVQEPLPEIKQDAAYSITPFWQVAAPGRAWVDLQNDVTTKDIELAYKENFRSVEHVKRYTTLGMATDQGKTSNTLGLAVLADLAGQPIESVGTTTFRPPYSPVELSAYGARATGQDFAPARFPASHTASEAMDAKFIEAGLWHRAAWYPQAGEASWQESCDREVRWVRNSVGVCDVSTLGKIDVQGKDAATFLDRIYTGTMSSLKIDRVRYGLMLREDGFVMDDGTVARMGEAHYVLSTTTAAAGQVMSHLEFCAQCLWPELDVALISVTEQWSQFAVSGPRARELLSQIVADSMEDDDLPFMACGAATVAGVAGRVFRISFSGELGFEIAVPANHGDALFRLLVSRAESLGGGAYGMEALNVLRIEKGFLTHAEIPGRVTAADVGLGRMMAGAKDCIGKVMSQRPGLTDAKRPQLVGLVPVEPEARLYAGAHLFNPGAAAHRIEAQGYITSTCHSPTLGHHIALGFLANGSERTGQSVRAVDFMRGERETECRVVELPFLANVGRGANG
ncbi:sarcosine oxidase subunit alpha family protein [Algicella marina]|uniref:Sarcosine oxidase subunit alpha family protein n=1 Tax=Algicella marina TaxID=2683284 RepID=A0A6P1T1S4_9RHOB|nr:sarcosine oxidase subunit alpha family protein [Algicella marina]QHQ35603.1 sarcosine oxidase subunit alpha family protein [Algicella marina]